MVNQQKNEAALRENNIKETYEIQLKKKQEEVDYYKDLKTRMSTKMVGETLEIHCSTEFNRMRPLFPNATLRKTTTHRAAARATSSSANATRGATRSCPSCSR